MHKKYAEFLISETKANYNLTADDFSRTRNFVWDLESLSEYISSGDKILDLGCGNGRLFEILKDKCIDYLGVDNSENLIEIARKKYPEARFETADVFNLPFQNDFFDKVFSIRALHHIPSKALRMKFLQEAKRVLKKDGILVLTCWNAWDSKCKINLLRMFKYGFLKIFRMAKLDFGDAFVPWFKTGNRIRRYYHFFTKSELRQSAEKSGLKVKKIWAEKFGGHSDIYLVAQKI